MKRLLLSTMAIIAISSSSVFADYTAFDVGLARESTPYLLTDFTKVGVVYATNQFSVSATVGSDILTAENIFSYTTDGDGEGTSSSDTGNTYAYLGFGYKITPGIAMAFGFQYNFDEGLGWNAYSPQIAFESDNFRINIPVTIAEGTDGSASSGIKAYATETEIRIYTPWDIMYYIRAFVNYTYFDFSGTPAFKGGTDVDLNETQQLFYTQVRFYFQQFVSDTGLTIGPQLRLYYSGGIGRNQKLTGWGGATAPEFVGDEESPSFPVTAETSKYFEASPQIAFSYSSDNYYFYIKPDIAYRVTWEENADSSKKDEFKHSIGFGTYIEGSVNVTPDLSVWLEANPKIDTLGGVIFTSGLGLTWYY